MIRNNINEAMQDLEICNYWIRAYQHISLYELNQMSKSEKNPLVKMSINFLIRQKAEELNGDVIHTPGYIL
jgi:hypothetical protein